MKPVTTKDLARRYGYFLRYLSRRGKLDHNAAAAAHVTPELIDAFIEEVRPIWRPVTLAQSIYKIRRMAEILAPSRDFGWLSGIEKDLDLVAYPKPRFDRILTSEQLVEAGLTLVREAELALDRRPIWRAAQMRNGVMLALLSLCPVRIKNFTALCLGSSFRREGDTWWIVLGRLDTKSRRPDERPVPIALNRAIALYLTWARPKLLGLGEFRVGTVLLNEPDPFLSGALWIGEKGDPLTSSALDRALRDTTRSTVGIGLSPHDFRRSAATTAALQGGSNPHLASALLQHTHTAVTQQHYNLASSLEAAASYREILRMRQGRT